MSLGAGLENLQAHAPSSSPLSPCLLLATEELKVQLSKPATMLCLPAAIHSYPYGTVSSNKSPTPAPPKVALFAVLLSQQQN